MLFLWTLKDIINN